MLESHPRSTMPKKKKNLTPKVVPREQNAKSLLPSAVQCFKCDRSFAKMPSLRTHYAWVHYKEDVLKSKPKCNKGNSNKNTVIIRIMN